MRNLYLRKLGHPEAEIPPRRGAAKPEAASARAGKRAVRRAGARKADGKARDTQSKVM